MMDPPEHGPARRAVLGEFTVKRLAALRPRIQEIVDEHLDAMLASRTAAADLVTALAQPVPSLVICEQLGVPYEDHEFFQSRSKTLLSRERDAGGGDAPRRDELRGYMDKLVERQGDRADRRPARPADRQAPRGRHRRPRRARQPRRCCC